MRTLILDFAWYVLFPLWLVSGIADWLCHRRTCIETTSGFGETAMHVAQMLQIAIPLLAVLFLEINALVVTVVLAGVLLHTLTFYWDVRYTFEKRPIIPFEQLVHCFLVTLPLFATTLMIFANWPIEPDWRVQLKDTPVPARYLVLILGSAVVFNLLPLLEEVWRTTRRGRSAAVAGVGA